MQSRVMRTGILIVVCWLALPATGGSEEKPVTITVRPGACVEPCSVRLVVRVAPDDSNRSIVIVAESETFYRSSTRPLEGAEAPAVQELLLNQLPAGRYDVRVVVRRTNTTQQLYASQFEVAPV